MTDKYQTSQEKFWAGEFGDDYCERNAGPNLVARNTALFARVFQKCQEIGSVIEFGANIGLNLAAIKTLLPDATLSAVEINGSAVAALRKLQDVKEIFHSSILEFEPDHTYDFAFIKGVLIHINPACLPDVYRKIHQSSKRYIFLAEYYNPVPVEVNYRGHGGKLFKRDFAGEMLDLFDDLRLVDYGFIWRRDPIFPQDDLTWFLMEKKAKCE